MAFEEENTKNGLGKGVEFRTQKCTQSLRKHQRIGVYCEVCRAEVIRMTRVLPERRKANETLEKQP